VKDDPDFAWEISFRFNGDFLVDSPKQFLLEAIRAGTTQRISHERIK